MQRLTLKYAMLVLTALAVTVAGWFAWNFYRDHHMNQDLFDEPLQTLCVGRYLIDVPAQYVLEYQSYRIDGVEIESLGDIPDEAAFKAKLAGREAELKEQKNAQNLVALERFELVDTSSSKGKTFYFNRTLPNSGKGLFGADGKRLDYDNEEGITIESLVWLDGFALRLFGDDLAVPKSANNVTRLATPLRALSAKEIPDEPGYCMEMNEGRAFIAGEPLPDQNEFTEIQFGLKHYPDVKFRLAMYPNPKKLSEPLSARAKRADAEMPDSFMAGVTSLRKAPRTVHDLPGEEIVEAVREKFTRSHAMNWEALGKINDAMAPMIEMEGQTGYHGHHVIDSSLSDPVLLKLWDAIVGSIRLRPTSDPAKRSEAPSPKKPLGELAMTGEICPETGWWKCAEEGAPVLGGSRQYIRQGEPMPDVVLLGKPSLWQRVKGETPQFRRSTVWTLKAYPDAPQEAPVGDKA